MRLIIWNIFALLTRYISILLLACVMWVQTPIAQLFKIGTLVEHYYEHKDENRALSILDFLSMHYAHDTDNHPGHDRDMQLPFKQCAPTSFALAYYETARFYLSEEKITYPEYTKPLSGYSSPYHAQEALDNIWQPPKACFLSLNA